MQPAGKLTGAAEPLDRAISRAFFLIWSLYQCAQQPLLMAITAADDASALEALSDEQTVARYDDAPLRYPPTIGA